MKIIKIENNNFNSVTAGETTFYELKKDRVFKIERVKNDIKGNPRYKLEIFEAGANITGEYAAAKKLGIFYKNNNYMIFQSYNIGDCLKKYFSNIDEYKLINYFDVWGNAADGWEINNLCDEFNFISEDQEKNIIQVLKNKGFLNKTCRLNQFDIYNDGYIIEFNTKKELKPLFRVELV